MGETTDTSKLIEDLGRVLPMQARDALAATLAAGSVAGPEGMALLPTLRSIAADELRDLERLEARVATVGGTPAAAVERLEPPSEWRAVIDWLAAMHRETLDALVEAIPAKADDAEGEATEHLLEHVISRKRDALEMLERALR